MSNKTIKINPFNKIILILLLLSSLFSGYLYSSIPVFFFALVIFGIYLSQIKFTVSQILVICIFFIYLIIVLINSTKISSTLSDLKWFYGILVFLIIFKARDVKLYLFNCLSSHKLFLLVLFIIFFETILINLFITPELVYGSAYKASTIEIESLRYNRPLGSLGNASATSTFIVAWYYIIQKENTEYKNLIFLFYSFSVILIMSSTGFILYFIALILNYLFNLRINFRIKFSNLLFTIFIFPMFFYLFSNSLNQKLSIDYYKNTIENKFSFTNLTEVKNIGLVNNDFKNIFGHTVSSDVPLNADDFGWLNLLYAHGILGFIIFFLIIFVFSNGLKKNRIAIIILFFGAFHYSSIFLAAGQMLLSKSIMNDK
jgi:hypothetical protein